MIGRAFDFDVLEQVGPLTGEELVAALEQSVDAQILVEDGERVGRYSFAHALMRTTLYESLSALRRARLHGRVGEALLARRGGDLDPHLGQLAHHFALAAPVDRPERAVDFALAAGRRADRLLAWEDAAGHYRAALEVRELAGASDDRTRCELLLALGASQERAGAAESRATFTAAAAAARALGDTALLGRAALGYAGRWSQLGCVEEDVAGLLQEALAALGSEDTPLRARLLARLAFELYYAGDPGRRLAISAEAVELARRLGDPMTLAACPDARHYALWRPETVHERLSELRRLAEAVGDPELELEGAGWTVVDLLELGDVAGADVQIAAASRLAAVLHRLLYEWWTSQLRCAQAQLAGDFDEAERLADETLAMGQRGQAENAVHVHAQAMFNIRREQGRLAEVEDAVRGFLAMYPAVPAWRCALAVMLLELGREAEARAEFQAMARAGFDTLPRDANWLIATTLLAEVCVWARLARRPWRVDVAIRRKVATRCDFLSDSELKSQQAPRGPRPPQDPLPQSRRSPDPPPAPGVNRPRSLKAAVRRTRDPPKGANPSGPPPTFSERCRAPSSPAPPAGTRRPSGTGAASAAASGTRWSRRAPPWSGKPPPAAPRVRSDSLKSRRSGSRG